MDTKNSVSQKSDEFKEHVQHLRFVHFSLVVTALALAIASLSTVGNALEVARRDVENIISLAKRGLYQTWLEGVVDQSFRRDWSQNVNRDDLPRQIGVTIQGTKKWLVVVERPEPFSPTLVGPRRFE